MQNSKGRLIFCLALICCYCAAPASATYPPSRSREGQLLDILMPRILLQDFQYVPTREGYRYSYQLTDGTRREEVGVLLNPDTPNEDLLIMSAHSRSDRGRIEFAAGENGKLRPHTNKKNRKLSPKSLQSLAG